jgi:16S rRNA (cytidine1402-2'-O)-methyltransferase
MAGTLFVVATPIGNLDDITVRALRVLRDVALVAAEDTRRSGNLLRHFGIPTRLVSLHAHNERSRTPQILTRLQNGESVALVSDAGTPGISDPGAELVRLAREEGIRVEAIPGASAVSAAISVAGLAETAFVFMGFAPFTSKDRKQWFDRLSTFHALAAVVCFEAPHRVRKTLGELGFYVNRPILLFRELTKLHEETLQGTTDQLIEALPSPVGEFTLVIPQAEVTEMATEAVTPEELRVYLGQLIENGANSRREAARELAIKFGLSTKFVYDATKGSGWQP